MALPTEYRRTRLPFSWKLWWSRQKRRWPFLIWLAAACLAVFLYTNGKRFASLPGEVEKCEDIIASPENARLVGIHVKIGDEVKPGDLVATYELPDDVTADYQQNLLGLRRQFTTTLFDAESELQNHIHNQARDIAELNVVNREVNELEELLSKNLIVDRSISLVRARKAFLEQSVESYPEKIEAARARLFQLRKQQENLQYWLDDIKLTTTSKRTTDETEFQNGAGNLPENLRAPYRKRYTLQANHPGVVTQVLFRPGAMIPANTPIAHIVQPVSNRVNAAVFEQHTKDLPIGIEAHVVSQGSKSRAYKAKVAQIVPEVISVTAVGRQLNQPIQRGRRVIVEILEPHELTAGEAVTVVINIKFWESLLKRLGIETS